MSRKNVTLADVRRAINNVALQRVIGKINRASDAGRLSETQEGELRLLAYGLQRRNAAKPATQRKR
ncbi:hypothetical protein [Thauera aromatica]|jgi:hypothetical protein|uniref:hypothetical protein n=1 Tax=Thauera aromatica TaxID=59405 RepID=UPI000D1557DD|nr:hypothetical protein [Thauera aromatica]